MSRSFISLTILLAALFVAGCRTADLPPGFGRVGGVVQNHTSMAASPGAVFSLLEWYLEANKDMDIPRQWNDYVRANRETALQELQRQWQEMLVTRSGNLLKTNPDTFLVVDPSVLTSRTNWDSIENQLRTAKALLSAPRTIKVPVDECIDDSFWNPRTKYGKGDFLLWAQNRSVNVPDPPTLNRQALLEAISRIHQAIVLKRQILQDMDAAAKLCENRKYSEALDKLTATQKALHDDKDKLEALLDTHTSGLLAETIQRIPSDYILAVVTEANKRIDKAMAQATATEKNLEAIGQMTAELEKQLTQDVTVWFTDARFQEARDKHLDTCRALLKKAAALRSTCWKLTADNLRSQRLYWDLANMATDALSSLSVSDSPQYGVYSRMTVAADSKRTFTEAIADDFRLSLQPMALEGTDALLNAAEQACNLQQKPGYAFALCQMAHDTMAYMSAQARTDCQKRLEELSQKAQKAIEATVLCRTISISDMTSSTPGLGMTYSKDLEQELKKLLIAFKNNAYVKLARGTTLSSPYSYVIFDGVVADFEGNETVERQDVRKVRRFGEIRRSPNPEAVKNSSAPPEVFTQEVYEQLINVREIERLAHIRVFLNLRGPGFTSAIELNEFYPRRFIIESSHPFNDVRVVDVIKTYDLTQHPVPDTEPVLRYDRVLTAGEMLDWARKDSLSVLGLKLIFHINQFPLMLENKAKHFEQTQDLASATEHWTYCQILCATLSPEQDIIAVINESSCPSAKCYEEAIAALRQQRLELIRLKQSAYGTMMQKANELYRTTLKSH